MTQSKTKSKGGVEVLKTEKRLPAGKTGGGGGGLLKRGGRRGGRRHQYAGTGTGHGGQRGSGIMGP